jgi:hypothetical protein
MGVVPGDSLPGFMRASGTKEEIPPADGERSPQPAGSSRFRRNSEVATKARGGAIGPWPSEGRAKPPVLVPVTPVTPSGNKLSRPHQLLRRAKSMRLRQGGPVAAPPARLLAPRRPLREPPRRPVCPRPRPARPNPNRPPRAPCRRSAPASPIAPRHPCAAFCAASPLTPRNPRQSAGDSNPSPPTLKNRTWLCLLATSGATTLRLGGYEQVERSGASRRGRVL